MNKDLIYILFDLKQYVNSKSYNAIELEEILEEHGWFAGSSDDNLATDGYDKLIMTENGTVEIVQITPGNIDRSDIQAYIRYEINQGNSICIDYEGNGAAGIDLIDFKNGEAFIKDLNSFSEPVEIELRDIPWSFTELITAEMGNATDVHIYRLAKKDCSVLIAVDLI